jgi:hypothetical protein
LERYPVNGKGDPCVFGLGRETIGKRGIVGERGTVEEKREYSITLAQMKHTDNTTYR